MFNQSLICERLLYIIFINFKSSINLFYFRYHFKFCNFNINYEKLALAIAIYTILICSYQFFVFLISSTEETLSHNKKIVLWFNAEKLVIQVLLVIVLIYGALKKKTFALISWTCISLALLATIKMGDDLLVIRENGKVYKILPDPLLYVLCGEFFIVNDLCSFTINICSFLVIDASAIFLVFNFFLNVKDLNSRQKKGLQVLIFE